LFTFHSFVLLKNKVFNALNSHEFANDSVWQIKPFSFLVKTAKPLMQHPLDFVRRFTRPHLQEFDFERAANSQCAQTPLWVSCYADLDEPFLTYLVDEISDGFPRHSGHRHCLGRLEYRLLRDVIIEHGFALKALDPRISISVTETFGRTLG
jgi:hypothetical protein